MRIGDKVKQQIHFGEKISSDESDYFQFGKVVFINAAHRFFVLQFKSGIRESYKF